ncbi:hypothetical protein R6258_12905 [Halomonas sp. HP20-15]|uniref:hypothetical protein n=1 Tax=Halomonas sp. HP20-15 TaxID=3085901 RepID=UPI002981E93A|nr:hypothetical protein [Halomonas sp. HP20-15]MDW5377825.1 hypothetical protein [Halomonas sp. HP20-15]
MRLTDKPTLAGGLLIVGYLLLATPLPVVADERRYDITFGNQTFGSDMHRGGERMRWQDGRDHGRGYDGRDYERDRERRDYERDYRDPYRDGRWHYRRDDYDYRDRHDGRHHDGRHHDGWGRDRDRYGHHGRPGAWTPNVEVIVDGVSSDGRRLPRDPREGPDRCHQLRSDSWSTGSLDCPEPNPPSRSQDWSSSQ